MKRWRGERAFHAHESARMDALNGLPLASFWRRAWAIVIDLLLVAIFRAVFHLNGHHENEAVKGSMGWFLIEGEETVRHLIESTLYFAVALKLGKGQTIGKWLMKIKVVSLMHESLTWWQSIERALGYGASLLEGGFGFLQYYIHQNRMCVHDRIAETIVIDLQRSRVGHAIHTDEEELAYEASEGITPETGIE
ncbi:RDD family protein [Granulicella cerasi]|uniref:RDD family protein n=1 Tax=Granulicella cerasi TaxID=741063 RepID=A0ABW1ZBA7_9BACT|nr:RDD family protein [Granulicella cerasi]